MTHLLCKMCTYYNHKTDTCTLVNKPPEKVRADVKRCGPRAVWFQVSFGKDGLSAYQAYKKTTDY